MYLYLLRNWLYECIPNTVSLDSLLISNSSPYRWLETSNCQSVKFVCHQNVSLHHQDEWIFALVSFDIKCLWAKMGGENVGNISREGLSYCVVTVFWLLAHGRKGVRSPVFLLHASSVVGKLTGPSNFSGFCQVFLDKWVTCWQCWEYFQGQESPSSAVVMCQGYILVHFGDYVLCCPIPILLKTKQLGIVRKVCSILLEQKDASLIFGIHGKIHSISIALLKFTLQYGLNSTKALLASFKDYLFWHPRSLCFMAPNRLSLFWTRRCTALVMVFSVTFTIRSYTLLSPCTCNELFIL
jgi:hypothetical protein